MVLLVHCFAVKAQQRRELDDLRFFSTGIVLSGNQCKFKLTPAPDLLQRDSVISIRAKAAPGFGFGGFANVRITNLLNFRFVSTLNFNQRNIIFTFRDRVNNIKVEQVSIDLALLFKYKSERHNNTRFYLIGGGRYSYDFSSNQDVIRTPFRPMVATRKTGWYYDYGAGMDFYLKYFKLSTELRMSNSITNMLSPDEFIYGSSISRIQSRLFQFSLIFE